MEKPQNHFELIQTLLNLISRVEFRLQYLSAIRCLPVMDDKLNQLVDLQEEALIDTLVTLRQRLVDVPMSN